MSGLIVMLVGFFVCLSWQMQWEWALTALPGEVTMKFVTAQAFVFAGFGVALRRLDVFAVGSAAVVLYLVAKIALAWSGVVGLYFQDADLVVKTVIPGLPSLGTFLCFLSVALALIFPRWSRQGAWLLMIIAGVAGTGYLLNVPLLYWHFPNASTAMAIHTAALFMLCGFGLYRDPRPAP